MPITIPVEFDVDFATDQAAPTQIGRLYLRGGIVRISITASGIKLYIPQSCIRCKSVELYDDPVVDVLIGLRDPPKEKG